LAAARLQSAPEASTLGAVVSPRRCGRLHGSGEPSNPWLVSEATGVLPRRCLLEARAAERARGRFLPGVRPSSAPARAADLHRFLQASSCTPCIPGAPHGAAPSRRSRVASSVRTPSSSGNEGRVGLPAPVPNRASENTRDSRRRDCPCTILHGPSRRRTSCSSADEAPGRVSPVGHCTRDIPPQRRTADRP